MNTRNLPPTQSKTLAQGVVTELAADIRNGVLQPGDRVPTEPELSRRFGVSRTVVRESMQRLQASGLVQTRHGIGTFVLPPAPSHGLLTESGPEVTVRDMLAMLELRIGVETLSAGLAAERRTEDQLAAMRATLDEFAAVHSAGANTTPSDFRFHLLIAQSTGNTYIEEVQHSLGSKTIAYTISENPGLGARQPHDSADLKVFSTSQFGESLSAFIPAKRFTIREHEDIFEAIRERDADAARRAMLTHLTNSRERLRKILELGQNH